VKVVASPAASTAGADLDALGGAVVAVVQVSVVTLLARLQLTVAASSFVRARLAAAITTRQVVVVTLFTGVDKTVATRRLQRALVAASFIGVEGVVTFLTSSDPAITTIQFEQTHVAAGGCFRMCGALRRRARGADTRIQRNSRVEVRIRLGHEVRLTLLARIENGVSALFQTTRG